MTEQKNITSKASCVGNCHKKFITCLESMRQDCLDHFKDCASTCKR